MYYFFMFKRAYFDDLKKKLTYNNFNTESLDEILLAEYSFVIKTSDLT